MQSQRGPTPPGEPPARAHLPGQCCLNHHRKDHHLWLLLPLDNWHPPMGTCHDITPHPKGCFTIWNYSNPDHHWLHYGLPHLLPCKVKEVLLHQENHQPELISLGNAAWTTTVRTTIVITNQTFRPCHMDYVTPVGSTVLVPKSCLSPDELPLPHLPYEWNKPTFKYPTLPNVSNL